MRKYVVLFRGGTPRPEEAEKHMKDWTEWMGMAFPQGSQGHPLQQSGKMVSGKRGATIKELPAKRDTVSGFMVFEAESYEEACARIRKCPVFSTGGKVEVREVMPMPGM
jgi:hypothetical protein